MYSMDSLLWDFLVARRYLGQTWQMYPQRYSVILGHQAHSQCMQHPDIFMSI